MNKLTHQDVPTIREARIHGESIAGLARKYGVSRATIRWHTRSVERLSSIEPLQVPIVLSPEDQQTVEILSTLEGVPPDQWTPAQKAAYQRATNPG